MPAVALAAHVIHKINHPLVLRQVQSDGSVGQVVPLALNELRSPVRWRIGRHIISTVLVIAPLLLPLDSLQHRVPQKVLLLNQTRMQKVRHSVALRIRPVCIEFAVGNTHEIIGGYMEGNK